ncbi:PilZ domain-containing protein [Bradyrhizobium erythrophlei]|uniref:PilZ domain-containing protein n=1 Tax=Bradyrhizobium erythrophlei TaxID=1437360 RepID=A0A1M7TRD2_9BRAD|nr:PilZ domain-containing protein [Bradyrhizobium erythrophlei]SHN73301.1 PilZ domain-containing protein [Bradyrhizobium erythrophlei]
MVQTRSAPRVRVAKPAIIECGGDKTPCIVRDISMTGASLEVSQAKGMPSTFSLILSEERLNLRCRVVWRRDFRLGVTFD